MKKIFLFLACTCVAMVVSAQNHLQQTTEGNIVVAPKSQSRNLGITAAYDQGIRLSGSNIDVTGSFETDEKTAFAWHVVLVPISVLLFSAFLLFKDKRKNNFAHVFSGVAILFAFIFTLIAGISAFMSGVLIAAMSIAFATVFVISHSTTIEKKKVILRRIFCYTCMILSLILTYVV
ncbi:MAG: hypothetical protein MUD00_02725 [Candidatus Pacebacteria bacterium]|jgi:hypothetical protein|nr:hypothetical protein [Candidatus Paceibacterota bacterium]